MALSEDEWRLLYNLSVANGTDIKWIRKALTENAIEMKDYKERMQIVERDQAFIRGKMARFAGGVAAVCAIAVNGILWVLNHIGGK